MTKKLLALLIAATLLLAGCGGAPKTDGGQTPDAPAEEPTGAYSIEPYEVDPNAPAHEQLFTRVKNMLAVAAAQSDVGMTFAGEYVYGLAQAEVSSLRLTLDELLWLLGEGERVEDLIGDAPFSDWDAIVGAGLGSDAPFYFEGLLYTYQGKTDEAANCEKWAKAHPEYRERDFYYLRNLPVAELYAIRADAAALESEVFALCRPRSALVTERTGAEYSQLFHLTLAERFEDEKPALAAQCALNALLADPMTPVLYSSAALYAMKAEQVELAFECVNAGLFAFPEDASINYVAATLSAAMGDAEAARGYLDAARPNADEALLARIDALSGQIGG